MSQPKFCAKCGSQLNENERFCGRCGEPVEAVIPEQQSAGSVQTPEYTAVPTAGAEVSGTKDKKKVMLAVIAAAAIVLLIVVIIVIINTTKYQKIDAKELFKIEFKGINGLGNVRPLLIVRRLIICQVFSGIWEIWGISATEEQTMRMRTLNTAITFQTIRKLF